MNEEFTPKKTTDEDWIMSEPNENLPPNQMLVQPIEDWSMTGKLVPPKTGTPNEWKMPEPKFQASSGTLPQNFVKEIEHSAAAETQPLDVNDIPHFPPITEVENVEPLLEIPAEEMPQIAQALPIEPQPDIAEAFSPAPPIEPENLPEEKQRSKAMRIFLAVLGISVMLFFAVGFLVLVYFLFFWRTAAE